MKLAKGTHRVPRTNRRLKIGIALALCGTAIGAHGAGLGRLNVLSSIGQPLRAEIELTSVTRDEGASLTARLATPDTFKQASIDYGTALTGLRFSIQRRAGGQPYVLVTSTQLLNEPFLDVLVELTWSSGRLVREYTMLIDPPDAGTTARSAEPGPTIVQAQTPAAVTRTRAPRAPSAPSGDAVGGGTSAPVRSSGGATGGPAAGSAGGDYVVRNGDTAISIAREYKPDNVTLEQMLAALYRDNSGAFNGNINRLNAGATVKIPDAASAQSVETGQAHRIVAQSANFGSYRDRIARNAALAPTARESGQQASGRLTTQVEDRAAPVADAKDRLQLSRPDATRPATTSGGTRTGLGGPSAADLAAKDRELVETKTRLALLEKNVADLQKLLELKSQSLADLQKAAPAGRPADVAAAPSQSSIAAAPAVTPVAAPVVVAPPSAATTPPAAAATVTATTPDPAPVAAAPVPAPAPAPAPVVAKAPAQPVAPPPESSWFDSLMENSLLLAGLVAVVVLLVGYAIFTARRRRKLAGFEDSIFVDNSVLHANSVFGTTGGQSVDTANSGFHSNFVPVAGNLPEQNEVDPVAEADVYIAYGRDAQAEEILKEALRADASRPAVRLKLLEIYAKRGDAKMFETTASELYAATGGHGPDWSQAAALGLTIDPHNPLYSDGDSAPAAASSGASSMTSSMTASMTASPSSSIVQAASFAASSGAAARPGVVARNPSSIDAGLGATGLGLSDFGVEPEPASRAPAAHSSTEYTKTDPLPRAEPNTATSAPSMDLDFDLGFANTGIGPLTEVPEAPAPAPAPSKNSGLDFDVGASTKPLIDPFTASAFGGGDASARTAVNLPAFRARAENEKPARPEGDGFSASDIFGSSIVADNDPEALYGETPNASAPASASGAASAPASTPPQARTQDFRNVVDNHQFDKTEPLDAFSKINLDLDDGGYQATTLTPESAARTDVWQAMATKLDLALAYSDIGDKDGARELLEEVVRNGDTAQAGRARTLIAELG